MSDTPKASAAAIGRLLEQLAADPGKPDDVAGEWRFAALVEADHIEVGVWEAEVGVWPEDDYPTEEVVVILAGHLVLTESDGTVLDLREGDMAHIPKGWSGTWDVREDMRKAYVILP